MNNSNTSVNNILISVIIPVYNVEKYLRKCLDSVVNQTYKNLEIICVNDCSTDSSPDILEEYAQKDSRIIIMKNTENLGLGLTRNEGIKIASGDFIHCLDSDDWMNLNAYEILVKYLTKDVDIVTFTYTSIDDKTKKTEKIEFPYKEYLYKNINIYNTPDSFSIWNPSAWTKIYNKEFIIQNNLFYNDYRCLEDIEYAIRAAMKAESIIFIKENLLNYRAHRDGSLLTKRVYYIDNIVKDTIWTNENTKELSYELKTEILNYMYKFLITNCLDAYYLNIITFEKLKKIFNEQINLDYFSIPYLSNIVKKVIKYNEKKFFCSYKIRRFAKETFPTLMSIYFKIKRSFINAH